MGIQSTFQVLAKSNNGSATRLLEQALVSSEQGVRKLATENLVHTRGIPGAFEFFRKFNPTDKDHATLVSENKSRLQAAFRAAITGDDNTLAQKAFRIIYTQRVYEMLPFMLNFCATKDEKFVGYEELQYEINRLIEKFVESVKANPNFRSLYSHIFIDIVRILTKQIHDMRRTNSDMFLMVTLQMYDILKEDDAREIIRLLSSHSSPAFRALKELLHESRVSYVLRFISQNMERANPHPLVLNVIATRTDMPFVSALLTDFNRLPSSELRKNIGKLKSIEWLLNLRALLDQLDEPAQIGLVRFIDCLDITPSDIQLKLLIVFHHGKPEGRLAAFEALAKYPGERIDTIVWDAADDTDSKIQVAALTSIQSRNLPNMMSRFAQFVDSPNGTVRETVKKLLPELRFSRFIEIFEKLDDDKRRTMFQLIQKLDSNTIDLLAQMLVIGDTATRVKALLCIGYGNMAPSLEDALCGVLSKDESVPLRVRAAELLADGRRSASRSALVQAFHRDPAEDVREAAKTSLEKRPVTWN